MTDILQIILNPHTSGYHLRYVSIKQIIGEGGDEYKNIRLSVLGRW